MARPPLDPMDFGVSLSRTEFSERLAAIFDSRCRDKTIDELVLHPREALLFCDEVRGELGAEHVSDDVILRTLMNRRKRAKKSPPKTPPKIPPLPDKLRQLFDEIDLADGA